MSPSIRNVGISTWEKQTGITREELKAWVDEKVQLDVQLVDTDEGWANFVLYALQLWSGIWFSTFEDITTQFDSYEENSISIETDSLALELKTVPVYDDIDWGKYENISKDMCYAVIWKHWISQIMQGGLIDNENDSIQLALNYEYFWLIEDVDAILGVV